MDSKCTNIVSQFENCLKLFKPKQSKEIQANENSQTSGNFLDNG
jgi:hypothetical protein